MGLCCRYIGYDGSLHLVYSEDNGMAVRRSPMHISRAAASQLTSLLASPQQNKVPQASQRSRQPSSDKISRLVDQL